MRPSEKIRQWVQENPNFLGFLPEHIKEELRKSEESTMPTNETDDLSKYLDATNGEGPLADLWKNKPHQIVSELMIHVRQLQTDNLEFQQTFDLQQSRVRIATKEWQKAHGKPNVLPDLGMLIDWMWGQVKVCELLIGERIKPPETVECCPTCAGLDRAHPGSIMRKHKSFLCGDPWHNAQ